MSKTSRFLVAKYVPDLHRMEPKNIGVVLATPDRIGARFYGQGEDKLRVPEFIQKRNKAVYKEWVHYWSELVNEANSPSTNTGRKGIDALEHLQSKSKGSYILVNGGTLLAKIAKREFLDVLGDLFNQFVGELPPKVKLTQLCDDLITRSLGEKVERNYSVSLKVGNISHPFKFNYAMPDGDIPHALYQRVTLNNPASVNSATLMFRSACESGIKPDRCGALVAPSLTEDDDSTAMLELYGKIVDVTDVKSARKKISEISGLS